MDEAYQDIGLVFRHLWSDLVDAWRSLDTVRLIYAKYSKIVSIESNTYSRSYRHG